MIKFWVYPVLFVILLILGGWAGWKNYNQNKAPDTSGIRKYCGDFVEPRHPLSNCLVRLKISGKQRGWQEDLRRGLWFHYTDKEPKSCFALYQQMDEDTIIVATIDQCEERLAMIGRFINYYNNNYPYPALSLDRDQIFSERDYTMFSQHEMWLPPSPQ